MNKEYWWGLSSPLFFFSMFHIIYIISYILYK
nr:MAG TPA: hypothetical protein [Bacteriophage sp.]